MTIANTAQVLLIDGIVSRFDEQGQKQYGLYLQKLRTVTKEAKEAGDVRYMAWIMAMARAGMELEAENS